MNRYTNPILNGITYTAEEISLMTGGQSGPASVRQKIRNGVRVAGQIWEKSNGGYQSTEFLAPAPVVREPPYYSPHIRAVDSDIQCINPLAYINGDPFWHVFHRTKVEFKCDNGSPFVDVDLHTVFEALAVPTTNVYQL